MKDKLIDILKMFVFPSIFDSSSHQGRGQGWATWVESEVISYHTNTHDDLINFELLHQIKCLKRHKIN